MNIKIAWQDKMHFQTETPSGHLLSLDGAVEVGGENKGPRPTEILLSAVGTCSGIDIVDILHKMRLQVETFHIEVDGKRNEDHPKRFTNIKIHYQLTGKLPEEKVRRAICLSLDKYCSVAKSLNTEITATFDLNGQSFQS